MRICILLAKMCIRSHFVFSTTFDSPIQRLAVVATVFSSAFFWPLSVYAADLSTLGDNAARDLGVYNCADLAGDNSCRRVTDYSGFSYDANHNQMLMFGGGHSTTMRDDVDEFNLTTLTWKSATATPNTSTNCNDMWISGALDNYDEINGRWINTGHATSRHTFDLRAVTKDGSELVILRSGDGPGGQCTQPLYNAATDGGLIAHYNINNKTWRFTVSPPWSSYSASEVDPISGQIIVYDYLTGLWVYDPATGTTPTKVLSFTDGAMGYGKNLVYFPPNDRFYYFGEAGRTWEVSVVRSGSDVTAASIQEVAIGSGPSLPETGFAYDAKNKVIGGGVYNNQFHIFNPISQVWAVKTIQVEGGGSVGTQAFHALDYDPVANVYIFISDYNSGFHVWAYRLGAGAVVTDIAAPSVPTTLNAMAASVAQINVSWSVSSDNIGVAGYKVYRNGGQIKLTTATTFNDTDLTAATTYTYAVAAYDLAGNTSAQTATVSATTSAAPEEPAPGVTLTTPLSAVAVNAPLSLSWSSANTTSCTASNGWNGNKPTSGSETINSILETSTYTLTCTGLGGSTTAAVTVTVNSGSSNDPVMSSPSKTSGSGAISAWESLCLLIGGLLFVRRSTSRSACTCWSPT